MRFSAWSSLVISACSALALALFLVPAAAADVEVSPQRIDPGSTARLVFWVANNTKTAVNAGWSSAVLVGVFRARTSLRLTASILRHSSTLSSIFSA